MTARSVDAWVGASPDSAIPARVKLRTFERFGGRCASCGIKLGGSVGVEYDHVLALVLGGENAEDNLQPLCRPCHSTKTAGDVKAKAKSARIRERHLGIKKPSRFPGSRNSPWKAKIGGGWERRDGT